MKTWRTFPYRPRPTYVEQIWTAALWSLCILAGGVTIDLMVGALFL